MNKCSEKEILKKWKRGTKWKNWIYWIFYLLQREFVLPNRRQGESVRSNQDKVTGANSVGAPWTCHHYRE